VRWCSSLLLCSRNDSGWDNGVDYDAWASGKKFKVGDTIGKHAFL
jgi:hypothetical protein